MNCPQEIINYIIDKYNAKVIILVGSRVVGDYNDKSDWDFFVFTPQLSETSIEAHRNLLAKLGEPQLEDYDIDVRLLPYGIPFSFTVFDKKLRFANIVYDTNDYAKGLMVEAKEFYKYPKRVDLKIYEWKSQGYLTKFSYISDHYQLFLRLVWYVDEILIPAYFSQKNEWVPRPQQVMENLDEKFKEQLNIMVGECVYADKINAARRAHEIVFTQS